MEDSKLRKVYDTIVKEGYDVPDFATFETDMRDDNKLTQVRDRLVEDGYELPEFGQFKIDMFGAPQPQELGVDQTQEEPRFKEAKQEPIYRMPQALAEKELPTEDRLGELGLPVDVQNMRRAADRVSAKEQELKAKGADITVGDVLDYEDLKKQELMSIADFELARKRNEQDQDMSFGDKMIYRDSRKDEYNALGTIIQAGKEMIAGTVEPVYDFLEHVGDWTNWEGLEELGKEGKRNVEEYYANSSKKMKGLAGEAASLVPQTIGMVVGALTRNPNLMKISTGVQIGSSMGQAAHEAKEAGAGGGQIFASALVNGAIEYGTERIPLQHWLKKVSPTVGRKVVSEATEKALSREADMLIDEARKTLGNKLTVKTAGDFAKGLLAEGGSEYAAEFLQTFVPLIYESPEKYPTLWDAIKEGHRNGVQGFRGGVMMASVINPAASYSQRRAHDARRREQGYVDIAAIDDNGKTTIVEILGVDQKGDLIGMKDGEDFIVDKNSIKERKRYEYDFFKYAENEFYKEIGYENTMPEAVDGNAVVRANKVLRDAENAAKTALGLESDTSIEDFIGDRSVDEVAMGDESVAEALDTYFAEKAKYEGMQDKMKDARESEYMEADKSVDAVAHEDGNVYRTALPETGETIFITGGKVVLDNEGYIDANQSEGLVALMPNSKKEAVQAGNIRDKVIVENVQAQKAAKRAEIDARYKQQLNTFIYTDKADGIEHTVQLVSRGEQMARVILDGVEQDVPNNVFDEIVAEVTGENGKALQTESGNVKGENQIEVAPVVEGQKGENAEKVVEPMGEAAAPVVETPKTALEQIPRNEKNIPLYEQVDSELAWDGVVEEAGGNEETAMVAVNSMIADKQDALKKAEKAKARAGVTITEKIAAENERVANIEKAKADLAKWEEIAGVKAKRALAAEAESKRVADEAAAKQRAEEERLRAEREEAERAEREALNGVPDMVDDKPQDARARGYRRVNGHKVDRQEPVHGLMGKEIAVKFSDSSIPTGRIAVIEAEQLQPSHIQGQRNPLHFIDEAQPKERNDAASVLSARKIAENVRPEEITSSVTAYTGAPTVNTRGEAVQGNNRSAALRLMWENNPEQAAKYKQYLMDHAAEFGLNAEDVAAMKSPVLVNMLDVSDADAITLGQYVAQDTESGGTERIKPKNVMQKMGGDMRSFANKLLASNNEEASFAELVDANGTEGRRPEGLKANVKGENGKVVNVNAHSVIKSENEKKALRKRAEKWAKKLGVKVHVLESYDEVTDEQAKVAILEQRTPGWFAGGEVYIYMPHSVDEVDIDRTVVHESVAHKGIKQMLGKEFGKFLDNVWNAMSVPAKAKFLSYVGAGKNATQADRRAAADEYVAALAEKVYKKQGMTAEEKTIWQKFADWFRKKFNVDEAKAEVLAKETLTDEDIAKMIRASYETLKAESGKLKGESGGDFRARRDDEVASVDGDRAMFRLASSNASAIKYDKMNGTNVKEFFDFLRGGMVFEKGKPNVFHIANAGNLLERYGIKGKFMVGQFTFSRTHTQDDDHNLGVKEWVDVINNLNNPLAITSYKGLPNEYRIYTYAMVNGKNICVGVNVSLKDGEIELSRIISAYGRDINNLLGKEGVNLLYPDMNELKRRILQGSTAPNSLLNATSTASADKDNTGSAKKQGNGTKFRKVTPEMDAEYMSAVENGDMETAERLVKEAVRLAMPDTKVVDEDGYPMPMFHGDRKKGRYVFSTDTFFTPNEQYAKRYTGGTGEVYPVYLNIENPFDVRDEKARDIFTEFNGGRVPVETTTGALDWGQYTYEDLQEYIEENYPGEYDGFILDEGGEPDYNGNVVHRGLSYIPFTSSQAKYSSAVTYDDNGNVIPLSERFNEEKEDIRFRKVFHGSGAQFDKFDHSFMGSGEGAQAYGWGTYVTDVEGIGRTYATTMRDKLISEKHKENAIINKLAKQTLESSNGNKEEALDYLRGLLNESWSDKKRVKAQIKIIETGKFLPETKVKAHLYTVEIPDDNGSNYLHWEDDMTDAQIADIIEKLPKEKLLKGMERDGISAELPFVERVLAWYEKLFPEDNNKSGESIYTLAEYALGSDKAASQFLNDMGFVGISYPANATTGGRADGARNYVIFNENDAVIEDRTMFRRANKNQDIFVSNAQRAVEGIKQEKATPEQWIAMLKKNGGLKAGEEAWLGLEEWLTEKGKVKGENGKTDPSAASGSSPKTGAQSTVTKQEILDFIGENKIQIEEVEYTQFGYGLMDEATRKLEAELKEIGWDAMVEKYPGFDELFEVYDGELLWSEERASVGEYEDFIIDNKIVDLDSQSNAINETREKYTTEGLERKREIALTVPTIEPYNESDEVHFGDAGNGRAVAWVRFGETTDSEGNRVLVIDEIQSKRHQDGREKGYRSNADKFLKDNGIEVVETDTHIEFYKNGEIDKRFAKALFNTDIEKAKNLYVAGYEKTAVPSAPFEKNWHELAMKRMLRLAAEEGFDKVAWTTGEQQAERYNMSKQVERIDVEDNGVEEFSDGTLVAKNVTLRTANDNVVHLYVDADGVAHGREFDGKSLAEIVGKELAEKIMQPGDFTIEGDGLRIGGEGMKGFYDRMLPSFVSKYTKKWGAKVGEVTMPNLRENNTMWSVDVTPEMQESVMEGQTMFRKMNEHAEEFNKTHKGGVPVVEIDPNNMEADFAEDGFATEEIEELKERMKKGVAAVYNTDKKIIYLLVPSQDKESVYSTCWHEDTHAAIDFLGLTPEMMDEFYSFAQGKKKEAFEALLDKIGYEIEEYPEESLAYGVQAMHILDNWGAETLSKLFGSTAEGAQRQMEIIQPLIDYINNGRQGTQSSVGEVVRDRGMYNNTANQKKTAETEGTGATATGGLTEGGISFRKAEQMGEDEVVLTGNAVAALGKKLNIPARVVNDVESLPENKRDKKGWIENGEVVVVLDNHVSMEDAMQTVLHEIVGRKGLRAVMGEEFDALLDNVYKNLPKSVKSRINNAVMTRFVTPRQAVEEYLAELAGKGDVSDDMKQWMRDYFRNEMNLEVEDGELQYMLWKNNQRLQTPDVLSMVQDFVMETETNTGDNGTRFRVVNDTAKDAYEKNVRGRWNKVKEGHYDRLRSVRKALEAIADETGMPISDSEDVYSYAEHLPSINKIMKEQFDNKFLTPFIKLLKRIYDVEFNGKKLDEKSVERYTNAKHGLERNRDMAVANALTTVEEVDGKKKPVFNKGAYEDWQTKKAAILAENITWEEKQDKLDELAKTYGAKLKDYSGLTAIFDPEGKMKYRQLRDEAIKYVTEMEGAIGKKSINELWKIVKGMTDFSLKQSYESGLLSKDMYGSISKRYEFYVPLRGFTEETAEDYYDYLAADHTPLNSVIKRAEGRKSEADNIFATILNMANSAIVFGNKNRLKQRVLNLATRHKSSLLSVDRAWYEKKGEDVWELALPVTNENMTEEQLAQAYADFEADTKRKEALGEARRQVEGLNLKTRVISDQNKAQHAIRVKRNGREYIVWVNASPTMANAVNGMLREEETGWALSAIDAINKFRSKMVTQFSPTFVLTNLYRDVQSASTVYGVRRGAKALGQFEMNVMGNSVKMMGLYAKFKKGTLDENVPLERYFKEFLENGGETGYTEMISIEEYNKALNELTEKLNIKNATRRALEAAGKGVEFANRCVENLCRFSAYMTSRENGISILQSVNDAKEVSVNFNRKGSGAMGAGMAKRLFMFYNPAVQALVQRYLLVKNYPKRMIPVLAGEFALGAMQPILFATISALVSSAFDDDDDETWEEKFNRAMGRYYNLTDYRRRGSVCLPLGDGVFNLPLAHESRVLFGLGELAMSWYNGHETYDNIPAQAMDIIGQSLPLNPVEGWAQTGNLTESLLLNLTPDALKPFAENAANRDFAGNKIHNASDMNAHLPEYMRGKKSTAEIYNRISKLLSGGKSGFERGFLDKNASQLVNPSKLEHLVEGYLGGAYTFGEKLVRSASWAMGNEENADARNIPFVSSFYTPIGKYEETPSAERTRRDWERAFDYYQGEMKLLDGKEKAAKRGLKFGMENAAETLEAMQGGEALMVDVFNDGNKILKELYADIDAARTAKDFDKVKEIDQEIYAQKRFITERMEQMVENPAIGYTFKTNKSEGAYGERETYGDVRDMNVINEFQRELKPLFEAYMEELKTLGEIEQLALYQKNEKMVLLYNTLKGKEQLISNNKKAMKENPEKADEYMDNIRRFRAEAVELINKYRNE